MYNRQISSIKPANVDTRTALIAVHFNFMNDLGESVMFIPISIDIYRLSPCVRIRIRHPLQMWRISRDFFSRELNVATKQTSGNSCFYCFIIAPSAIVNDIYKCIQFQFSTQLNAVAMQRKYSGMKEAKRKGKRNGARLCCHFQVVVGIIVLLVRNFYTHYVNHH